MLSEVPQGWISKALGDVCAINMGQSPKSSDVNDEQLGMPFLQGCAEFGDYVPTPKAWITKPLKVAEEGDILFSVRAPVGKMNIAPVQLCIGRGLCAINSKSVEQLFLKHLLTYITPKISSQSQGSTFQAVNKKQIHDAPVLLPPLNEQHRIAEILSSVDASIQATQAVIKQAERVKRGLMEELLTGGLGSEAIERGEVPEGWEIITLASDGIDLIDGDRGKQYPKSNDFSGDGYCLFLSAKNVTKQGFKFDEKQFVTKEKHEALRKGALKRDDIVVTTRGTVGNVAHFSNAVPYDIVRINSGMAIVRNQSERVLTDYLVNYLASSVVDEQIKLRTHGSAQPALTIQTLKTLRLAMPSLTRQQDINSILLSQNTAIEASFAQLHSLQRLKSALMNDLLTGKVRTA